MSARIVVRPEAVAELIDAKHWYEAHRPGLGSEFVADVDAAIARIVEHPLLYPVVHRETRRTTLRRFPYAVVHRVLAREIVILAVVHGHRDPAVWRGRT